MHSNVWKETAVCAHLRFLGSLFQSWRTQKLHDVKKRNIKNFGLYFYFFLVRLHLMMKDWRMKRSHHLKRKWKMRSVVSFWTLLADQEQMLFWLIAGNGEFLSKKVNQTSYVFIFTLVQSQEAKATQPFHHQGKATNVTCTNWSVPMYACRAKISKCSSLFDEIWWSLFFFYHFREFREQLFKYNLSKIPLWFSGYFFYYCWTRSIHKKKQHMECKWLNVQFQLIILQMPIYL